MYIVIEGIDTAGKSTQLDILKKSLPDAIFTKEPGGTKLGLKLREMVLSGEASSSNAEMFLFLADRAEHTKEIIEEYKEKIVVSDRSLVSGVAYAQDLKLKKLIKLNKLATSNTLPTHTILLKLSSDELKSRLSKKQNDNIEQRGEKYLLNIQDRMEKVIKKLNLNYIIIDASRDIETIAKEIKEFIS